MNEREHVSGWIWKARSGRPMPASNRFHMMSRMDRRIFLRELDVAGATVLAGCTKSTATSGRPAPAAGGPGRSRAALDRMRERTAGLVEIPGIVVPVTRGDDVRLDVVGTCTLASGTSAPLRRPLQPEDRSRRRIHGTEWRMA
jgi:hypothetical protein